MRYQAQESPRYDSVLGKSRRPEKYLLFVLTSNKLLFNSICGSADVLGGFASLYSIVCPLEYFQAKLLDVCLPSDVIHNRIILSVLRFGLNYNVRYIP